MLIYFHTFKDTFVTSLKKKKKKKSMALTLHQSGHGHSHGGLSSHGHGHSHKKGKGKGHNHGHSNNGHADLEQHGGDHGMLLLYFELFNPPSSALVCSVTDYTL